jgi:type II secretory pathway pseudopilin PulG
MDLEGQALTDFESRERGYAMAALLVSLAVMSVLMSVALPTWRHAAQREKEAELVFRGEQYARAIALYRAKNANAFPPSVDVLVQGRFLRKKYLDPITKKDFDVIGVGAQSTVPGQGAGTGTGTGSGIGSGRGLGSSQGGRGSTVSQPSGGRGASTAQSPSGIGNVPGAGTSSFNPTTGAVSGGIMGVHSKSQETSIRIYKGQTRYDQWNFVVTAVNRPGGGAGAVNPGGQGGAQFPGARGGRGTGTGTQFPGGRGGQGRGPGTGGQGAPPPPPPPPFPGVPRGPGGAGSDPNF